MIILWVCLVLQQYRKNNDTPKLLMYINVQYPMQYT